MKILITAFDPFGGDDINPALEAVKAIDENNLSGIELTKLEVPTVFGKSIDTLKQQLSKNEYEAVLCVGQAGGRFGLTPERVAINVDDARIPDNEGNQPIDEKIFADAPNAYFATLPIKAMVSAVKAKGLPASVSNTAGTFVCNHLMFGALHLCAESKCRAGFVHVPFIPEQVVERANTASMSQADITRGLEIMLQAIADHTEDITVGGGAIC